MKIKKIHHPLLVVDIHFIIFWWVNVRNPTLFNEVHMCSVRNMARRVESFLFKPRCIFAGIACSLGRSTTPFCFDFSRRSARARWRILVFAPFQSLLGLGRWLVVVPYWCSLVLQPHRLIRFLRCHNDLVSKRFWSLYHFPSAFL